MKTLIDGKADIHVWDDEALRVASENGHDAIVKILIGAKGNIHVWDDEAWRIASYNGYIDVVRMLIDAGAGVRAERWLRVEICK
jgi:hypothetical protein